MKIPWLNVLFWECCWNKLFEEMHSRSTVVGQNEQQFLITQMHDSESVKVKLGVIKTQLHLACHKNTVGMSVMKKITLSGNLAILFEL